MNGKWMERQHWRRKVTDEFQKILRRSSPSMQPTAFTVQRKSSEWVIRLLQNVTSPISILAILTGLVESITHSLVWTMEAVWCVWTSGGLFANAYMLLPTLNARMIRLLLNVTSSTVYLCTRVRMYHSRLFILATTRNDRRRHLRQYTNRRMNNARQSLIVTICFMG